METNNTIIQYQELSNKNKRQALKYDESFLKTLKSFFLPYYDIWSIRVSINPHKNIFSGFTSEPEKIILFLEEFANKKYPMPLIIVFGNKMRGAEMRMSPICRFFIDLSFENQFEEIKLGVHRDRPTKVDNLLYGFRQLRPSEKIMFIEKLIADSQH